MVKPGYKQTEIGIIPKTWKKITFGKCFKILSNNTLSRTELNEDSGTVKNIHYGDILVKYNSILNCSKANIPYISNLRKNATCMYLLDGDLIIADTAEDETVGKAIEISNIGNQKIVSGLHTIPCRALSDDLFANGWLGYYINHSTYHNQLLPFITGTKVSAISKSSIAETLVLVPPFYEQKRIVEALSDVDELISSLEKLIEKYKSIKSACLQQMFPQKGEKVPRMRLPGFTDAWEQRKVTELGKIYIGLVTTMTKHYTNEGTLLIRNSDIKDGRFEFGDTPIYLENTFAQENESRMHQIGDVITVHTGDVGTSAVITENEAKSIGFATIVTRPDTQIIVPNYLCTFLNTDKHKRWAVAISTGDGRTNYNLGDYYELVVPVPSIREQQAISSFVQNLNNLITLYQRKLGKVKKIKEGMMQQLLTGNIRLV